MSRRLPPNVLASIALSAALAAGATACLSDYGTDCNRNVDLQCFWEAHGITSQGGGGEGAGGNGGGPTTSTGEGGAGAAGGATMTTLAPVCGNDTLEDGEACDDGNTDDCDGCRADCSAEETGCGDGFVCGAEECDDGNSVGGDGCRQCLKECNTGTIQGGSNAAVYTDLPGKRCYVRVTASPKSWGAARTQCQQWKGDLLAFTTLAERDAVLEALPGPIPAWTCGTGSTSPDAFSWQSGDPWPSDAPWATGQPDSSSMECVELAPDGTLADQSCTKLNAYICERPLSAGP